MLTLSQAQMQRLAEGPRKRFVQDLCPHLDALAKVVSAETEAVFQTPAGAQRVEACVDWLLANGFVNARQTAAAVEMLLVFGASASASDLKQIVEEHSTAAKKLDSLTRLVGPRAGERLSYARSGGIRA